MESTLQLWAILCMIIIFVMRSNNMVLVHFDHIKCITSLCILYIVLAIGRDLIMDRSSLEQIVIIPFQMKMQDSYRCSDMRDMG